MVLHEKERLILVTIGSKGKMNINKLSLEAPLKIPTARRWLKRMRQLDLVWIINRRTKPKEEMVHSLTPKGIVLAFNNMELAKMPSLIANHGDYAPAYIIHYEKFSKKGLLRSARKIIMENDLINLSDVDSDKRVRRYLIRPNILRVEKNILNSIFIKKILNYNLHLTENGYREILIELINDDKDFKQIWRNWVAVQSLVMEELKKISKEAKID